MTKQNEPKIEVRISSNEYVDEALNMPIKTLQESIVSRDKYIESLEMLESLHEALLAKQDVTILSLETAINERDAIIDRQSRLMDQYDATVTDMFVIIKTLSEKLTTHRTGGTKFAFVPPVRHVLH